MQDETPSAPPPALRHLDEAAIQHVARNLRGVTAAEVRFFHTEKSFEEEVVALLAALEIPAETLRIDRMAPTPRRRFSFQFKGRRATITVAPDQPLMG